MERLRRDRSILDAVGGELKGLELILGPGDQIKLDEYLDALRDIERRIQMAEQQSTRELPIVDQPVGVPSDYEEHARLMIRTFFDRKLNYPKDRKKMRKMTSFCARFSAMTKYRK